MIKAVIFDIDGVLIDSLEANFRFYNQILEKFGRKPITFKGYMKLYGSSMKGFFRLFFPEKSEKEINEMAEYGVNAYRRFFRYVKLNPNVVKTLEILEKSHKLGIVTSRITTEVLEFFKIRKYFSAEVTYGDVKNRKPHPEPILLALKRLRVRPEEALYIGDNLSDFQAGKAAGVKVIIYRNPSVRGDYNIKDFREIAGIAEKLNNK
jgi:pyrophosphatase PpaX